MNKYNVCSRDLEFTVDAESAEEAVQHVRTMAFQGNGGVFVDFDDGPVRRVVSYLTPVLEDTPLDVYLWDENGDLIFIERED